MAVTVMIMTMEKMRISVSRVKRFGGMLPLRSDDQRTAGIAVHAAVEVHVPGLNARTEIMMAFEALAGSNRRDWAEIAYERALFVLDPA